jgi:hypothetical protein
MTRTYFIPFFVEVTVVSLPVLLPGIILSESKQLITISVLPGVTNQPSQHRNPGGE